MYLGVGKKISIILFFLITQYNVQAFSLDFELMEDAEIWKALKLIKKYEVNSENECSGKPIFTIGKKYEESKYYGGIEIEQYFKIPENRLNRYCAIFTYIPKKNLIEDSYDVVENFDWDQERYEFISLDNQKTFSLSNTNYKNLIKLSNLSDDLGDQDLNYLLEFANIPIEQIVSGDHIKFGRESYDIILVKSYPANKEIPNPDQKYINGIPIDSVVTGPIKWSFSFHNEEVKFEGFYPTEIGMRTAGGKKHYEITYHEIIVRKGTPRFLIADFIISDDPIEKSKISISLDYLFQ